MIKEDIQSLKAIKCTDFYLSKYLLEIRKFFPEAIIILTGDHVAGPNNFLRKKVKDEFLESSYDRTLLIIDDPLLNASNIDTNVFSITPDLFPTIIELLNGKEKKIHFGNSILSERRKNQEIISPEFQIIERIYNIPAGLSHKICVEEKEISEILHNCTRKRIFNYAENNFFPLN